MSDKFKEKVKEYLKDAPNYERFDELYNNFNCSIDFIKEIYPNELKTFEDLEFGPHSNTWMKGAVAAILEFDNGHFASVVGGHGGLYGDGVNTFELGYPQEDGSIDVIGWLNPEELTEQMFIIQMKKPFTDEQ